jgi:hypothetical protein
MSDLDDLLEEAGKATEMPKPPLGGIPKQWLPGWVRWSLRLVFLPFVWLDHFAQKLARFIVRPPFKKEGQCLKRGNCCHYILLPRYPKGLNGIAFFWYTQVHGFFLRFPESKVYENKQVKVMGCRYLQANGRCSQYHLRPLVCRGWPRIEYFGYPQILKGCGFKAVPRNPLIVLGREDETGKN